MFDFSLCAFFGRETMNTKSAYIIAIAIVIASCILGYSLVSLGESMEDLGRLIKEGFSRIPIYYG